MIKQIRVGRASQRKKVTKGVLRFPSIAIRRFCGFPMGLITLPVVIQKARANSMSLGEIPYFRENCRTSGVQITARV